MTCAATNRNSKLIAQTIFEGVDLLDYLIKSEEFLIKVSSAIIRQGYLSKLSYNKSLDIIFSRNFVLDTKYIDGTDKCQL